MDALMPRWHGCQGAVTCTDALMPRWHGCQGAVTCTDALMPRWHGCQGAVTAMVDQKPADSNASSKPQEKTPAQNKPDNDTPNSDKDEKRNRPPSCYLWAELLARVFGIIPICPNCGTPMCVIAFIQSDESLNKILTHVGLPTKSPEISSARGPPGWQDIEEISQFDASEPQCESEYEFDQTVNW